VKSFVEMLAAHSAVRDGALLEHDVRLHFLLRDLAGDPNVGRRLAFRGGTCLVKCYLGYERFSADLDFTMIGAASQATLSSKELRRRLRPIQRALVGTLSAHAKREGWRFDPAADVRYGQSNRMMAANLRFEIAPGVFRVMKVDVNFAEPMEFEPVHTRPSAC